MVWGKQVRGGSNGNGGSEQEGEAMVWENNDTREAIVWGKQW